MLPRRRRCCGFITVIVVLPHDYSVIFCLLLLLRFKAINAAVIAIVVALFFRFTCMCFFVIFYDYFFPRNVQLLCVVCIVRKNEGGNFRKTMCNELSL